MAKKKTTKVATTATNDADIVKEPILDNIEEANILIPQSRQTKHDLEYLLFLEKAAGVICRKYENLAKAYPGTYHDLSFGEYDDKYMKFSGIYNKIIEKIENTLIDWEEKGC